VVDRFTRTRFASFLTGLVDGIFTKPSRQNFLTLALGWTFALGRHTIATYLWRAGATALKHFTRYYVFFGTAFHSNQDLLFRQVIRLAATYVPEGRPIRVIFDETTCKKSGSKIEGASSYRNGAGTARQEWRTLYGVNFVIGLMQVPLRPWESVLSVPIGLRLYLKRKEAAHLDRAYRSRSELAREMLDLVSEEVGPRRTVISIQDGNYSTKKFLRGLPENVEVVGRLPIDSKLYEAPEEPPPGKPGRKPQKGALIGSAKTLLAGEVLREDLSEEDLSEKDLAGEIPSEESVWRSHPTEEGAWIRRVQGIWDSVLSEVMLEAVVVYRPDVGSNSSKNELGAFFTTLPAGTGLLKPAGSNAVPDADASQSKEGAGSSRETGAQKGFSERILQAYGGRWAVEILIRTAKQRLGLGKDQCRRWQRIEGTNAFRLFMAGAQNLFFAEQAAQNGREDLTRWRPWYGQKEAPSQQDVLWACRERLLRQGIIPTVGFEQSIGEVPRKEGEALARAG
jgi:hypothetical protein